MSRKNYRHNTMDALIGKPLYSNAMGTPNAYVNENPIGTSATFDSTVRNPDPLPIAPTPVVTTPTPVVTTPTATYGAVDYDGQRTIVPPIVPTPTAPRVYSTPTTSPTYGAVDYDGQRAIVPIIVTPTPIITAPLISGGGFGGGGMSGSSSSKVVAEKPNFIKKNIVPILLVGSAIYVIIKKPI